MRISYVPWTCTTLLLLIDTSLVTKASVQHPGSLQPTRSPYRIVEDKQGPVEVTQDDIRSVLKRLQEHPDEVDSVDANIVSREMTAQTLHDGELTRSIRLHDSEWLSKMGDADMNPEWRSAIFGGVEQPPPPSQPLQAPASPASGDKMKVGPCVYKEGQGGRCPSFSQEIRSLADCHLAGKLLGLTFAGAVASHHSPAGCIWAGDTVYVNQIRWDNTDLSNMTVGAVCVCKETALDEQALMEAEIKTLNETDSETLNSLAYLYNETKLDVEHIGREIGSVPKAMSAEINRFLFGACFYKEENGHRCPSRIQDVRTPSECELAYNLSVTQDSRPSQYLGDYKEWVKQNTEGMDTLKLEIYATRATESAPVGCIRRTTVDGGGAFFFHNASVKRGITGTDPEVAAICVCDGYWWQNQLLESEMYCDDGCQPCMCGNNTGNNAVNQSICTPNDCEGVVIDGQECKWLGFKGTNCQGNMAMVKLRQLKNTLTEASTRGKDVYLGLEKPPMQGEPVTVSNAPLHLGRLVGLLGDSVINGKYKNTPLGDLNMLKDTLEVYGVASRFMDGLFILYGMSFAMNVMNYRPVGVDEDVWKNGSPPDEPHGRGPGSFTESVKAVFPDYFVGFVHMVIAKAMLVEARSIVPVAFMGRPLAEKHFGPSSAKLVVSVVRAMMGQ